MTAWLCSATCSSWHTYHVCHAVPEPRPAGFRAAGFKQLCKKSTMCTAQLDSCSARRETGCIQRGRRRRAALRMCAASGSHTGHPAEQDEAQTATEPSQRQAVLSASKRVSRSVEEAERPLAEYMALPASQYSVLDAKKIDRIDERTFRCYVDGIQFFGLTIEPILTVSVTVGERGPTVKLLKTRLDGSPAVQAANDRFDATMTNVVQWSTSKTDGHKTISSDTSIQVSLEVPGWMKFIPRAALEKVGSGAMQGVLNTMVPRFLAQLQKDYACWASGDESRKPVGTGQL